MITIDVSKADEVNDNDRVYPLKGNEKITITWTPPESRPDSIYHTKPKSIVQAAVVAATTTTRSTKRVGLNGGAGIGKITYRTHQSMTFVTIKSEDPRPFHQRINSNVVHNRKLQRRIK